MGDRGQVEIINEGEPTLYLYTHWGASSLEHTVADALARGENRWSDPEYLNRIIFSEMIKDDVDSEVGYGIGFFQHGDVWKLVVINHVDKTVGIKVVNYSKVDLVNYTPGGEYWEWELEPTTYESFIQLYQKVSY